MSDLMLQTTYRENCDVKVYGETKNKSVALLYGGMSAERDVSISSSKGVLESLLELDYKVIAIDMGIDLAETLAKYKPDVVFNCLHGTYGEDGTVPGILNMLRIPYTHSGMLSSAICFNKEKSRDFFISRGINIAESILIKKADNINNDPMPRPYVIKPLAQGSSIGVQIIFPEDNFNFADYKFDYGDTVIIEKYVKGREMQVAVLNGKALGILEIKVLSRRFYDYEAKYTEGICQHIMPASLQKRSEERLLEMSEQIYKEMGCHGIARLEFIYNEQEDEFYTLEINTHPGFTPLSICPEIAAYNGISYTKLVEMLIKTAKYESQ